MQTITYLKKIAHILRMLKSDKKFLSLFNMRKMCAIFNIGVFAAQFLKNFGANFWAVVNRSYHRSCIMGLLHGSSVY